MSDQVVRIDALKWHIDSSRNVQPLCPVHDLRLQVSGNWFVARNLKCAECEGYYQIPRVYTEEIKYILDKIDSKVFKGMKVLNLDDEALPLAEAKATSEDDKYFATAMLTKSKVGLRLVVYAGEKGKAGKTQIFVEPDIKRLAFDQKDLHPSDVFSSLEATFEDGSRQTIEKKTKK